MIRECSKIRLNLHEILEQGKERVCDRLSLHLFPIGGGGTLARSNWGTVVNEEYAIAYSVDEL